MQLEDLIKKKTMKFVKFYADIKIRENLTHNRFRFSLFHFLTFQALLRY